MTFCLTQVSLLRKFMDVHGFVMVLRSQERNEFFDHKNHDRSTQRVKIGVGAKITLKTRQSTVAPQGFLG